MRELRIRELKYTFHLFFSNKLVVIGTAIVLFYIFLAVFGRLIVDAGEPYKLDLKNALKPPSFEHFFGTDDLGRDILRLIVLGAGYDMAVSIFVVAVSIAIGTVLGAVSAYLGGKFDEAFMRLVDILFAFPGLLFAMAIQMILGKSLFNLAIALIAVWWAGYARLMRGQVLAEKGKLYVRAAKSLGLPGYRILFRHILPNAIYPLLVSATMDIGGVMLSAAGLSFIGLGPTPFEPEWGSLVNRGAPFLFVAPWIMFFPGLMILLASLGFNLVGDGLRDILDPRLRR
ncbi:MAG: ABC transporter permease [Thermoproteota archaeon]|nr:ABC transporter permease [Candidatus Brockarchaeota archaeon]